MKYLHYDLGYLKKTESVKVEIQGTACNVFLLNYANFINYKNNRGFKGYGGLTKHSPVILSIPNYDHWYLVVDNGNVKVKVSVLNN